MALPGESVRTQVFHCFRVGHEDRVSGSRDASLAYCSLDHSFWYYEMAAGADGDGCGICIREVLESALLLRDRCIHRQRTLELHQRVRREGQSLVSFIVVSFIVTVIITIIIAVIVIIIVIITIIITIIDVIIRNVIMTISIIIITLSSFHVYHHHPSLY